MFVQWSQYYENVSRLSKSFILLWTTMHSVCGLDYETKNVYTIL
jgi:hypothetical protein